MFTASNGIKREILPDSGELTFEGVLRPNGMQYSSVFSRKLALTIICRIVVTSVVYNYFEISQGNGC